MSNSKIFNILATAIILKEPFQIGKKPTYFITQRADHEKTFPGMWTVPGGKLETDDYTTLPRQTEHYWYGVIETALRREVKEECNLDIKNIWYLTSLARVQDEGYGSLVVSFVADWAGGEVSLDDDMQDFTWVTFKEAKKYNLIDGILDEFFMIEKYAQGERDVEWQRTS
jgi:8-oxo-dGTP pyrophosphatase MutT (NUDIX family)